MTIKLAIVGLGNCASSLVQGRYYYEANPTADGLIHADFGGYKITDIEFVAGFDIDKRKVGQSIGRAIFEKPNCAQVFQYAVGQGGKVYRGPTLDGVASHMKNVFLESYEAPVDVVQVLKDSGADMLISYLPVGSAEASRFYAQACLDAGIGFINAIPEFICSSKEWSDKFAERGLACAGDDIKSQVGATILHRMLAGLIDDRGQTIDSTYQLNVGGNTDFENMIDESRLVSKRKSKTQSVISILSDRNKNVPVKIGPSDHISHLGDTKIAYINLKGRQFGGVPYEIETKLRTEDSPNSAGCMVDVIRGMKVAKDNGWVGVQLPLSCYYFKSPMIQVRDEVARSGIKQQYGL